MASETLSMWLALVHHPVNSPCLCNLHKHAHGQNHPVIFRVALPSPPILRPANDWRAGRRSSRSSDWNQHLEQCSILLLVSPACVIRMCMRNSGWMSNSANRFDSVPTPIMWHSVRRSRWERCELHLVSVEDGVSKNWNIKQSLHRNTVGGRTLLNLFIQFCIEKQ